MSSICLILFSWTFSVKKGLQNQVLVWTLNWIIQHLWNLGHFTQKKTWSVTKIKVKLVAFFAIVLNFLIFLAMAHKRPTTLNQSVVRNWRKLRKKFNENYYHNILIWLRYWTFNFVKKISAFLGKGLLHQKWADQKLNPSWGD